MHGRVRPRKTVALKLRSTPMPALLFAAMTAVTNLGDSAVLLSLVIVTAPYLWVCGLRRDGVLLVAASGTTAVTMAFLKMICLVCSGKLPFDGLVSPSGHTAMTIVVYGMLLLTLCRLARRGARVAAIALFFCLVAGVGITRVLLRYHSRAEVAAGFLVGSLILASFGVLLLRRRPFPVAPRLTFRPAVLGLLTFIVLAAMLGNRLHAESTIDAAATRLNLHLRICR